MATVDRPKARPREGSWLDPEGFPWLENGETMDRKTFHERYKQMPEGVKAELIGGIVYIMASPLSNRHARGDAPMIGWLFNYTLVTPGTVVQNNASTFLGEAVEVQPDCALLISQEYGGQTRDGEGDDEYTYGAPELVVEVALSSRSGRPRGETEGLRAGRCPGIHRPRPPGEGDPLVRPRKWAIRAGRTRRGRPVPIPRLPGALDRP